VSELSGAEAHHLVLFTIAGSKSRILTQRDFGDSRDKRNGQRNVALEVLIGKSEWQTKAG